MPDVLDVTCPIEWAHPLNRGLVGCWTVPPNDGWRGGRTLRGLVRGAKNPNDGTLTNMAFPATATSGWTGQKGRPGGCGALAFDGSDDYVAVGTGPVAPIAAANAFTFAAWVRRSGTSNGMIVGNYSGANSLGHMNIQIAGGALQATIYNGTTSRTVAGSTGGYADAWAHVAVAWNGDVLRIYKNGLPDGTSSSGAFTLPTTVTYGLAFCSIRDSLSSSGMACALDDLRLWSRALSAGEVASLYDQSRRGHPDTLRWLSAGAWFVPAAAGGGAYPWWVAQSGSVLGGGAI